MMRFALRTIEQAIRHALQKIDSANPTLRNKLYRTAWQTHEKMLADLASLTADEKQQRRSALKNIIQTIEAEFQPSTPPPPPPPSPAIMADPALIAPTRHQNEEKIREAKKPRGWRSNGFLLVLVAILLVVAWSFYNSLMSPNPPVQSDNASSSASPSLTELIEQDSLENLTALPQREETTPLPARKWIRIFDPANIAAIRTRGTARVQLHENEGENFIRLTMQGGEDSIILELGSGIMMQAQGKGAIFNLIGRSVTGRFSQLSVACDFGAVAACGRWRFELPPMREDLLFGIDTLADNIGTIQADSALTLTLALSGEASNSEYMADIFGLEVSFDD